MYFFFFVENSSYLRLRLNVNLHESTTTLQHIYNCFVSFYHRILQIVWTVYVHHDDDIHHHYYDDFREIKVKQSVPSNKYVSEISFESFENYVTRAFKHFYHVLFIKYSCGWTQVFGRQLVHQFPGSSLLNNSVKAGVDYLANFGFFFSTMCLTRVILSDAWG